MRLDALPVQTLKLATQPYAEAARKDREPVRRPRGNEKSRTFLTRFDFDQDEFDAMDDKEVLRYLGPGLRNFIEYVKEELGRTSIRFFRFPTPADTHNRTTVIFDEDPIFVTVTLCKDRWANQDIVRGEIRAEVQVHGDEALTKAERRTRDLDAAMLAMNPEQE
jgi:hypothetical protein